MRRSFLAAVVAALISPLPVVAQQSLSAAQDKKKETRGEDSTRPWTLLIYGAVDNDANDPFVEFLDQARRAFDNDPGIELLVFIDRSEKHRKKAPTYLGEDFTGTRLYRLTKDTAERLSGGSQLPEITLDKDVELNSADAKYVQQFIAWGKANYPAQRYALMIYSHANGVAMCPDGQSGEEMGFAELSDKVSAKERVDFLALELCNMGGIEIAYQWRPGNGRFEADVLLAIPNTGPPLDWDRALGRIRTPGHMPQSGQAVNPATLTAADFGKLVIEEGRLGRLAAEKSGRKQVHESAGCYDLHRVAAVKKAVDVLSVELAKAGARDIVLELRKGAISYGGPEGRDVDLYDLARRIAGCDRLPERVRESAKGVMATLERFVLASFGMSGYKGFEAGKNGVYIVLPSGTPGCWQRFRWYTPLTGAAKARGGLSFLRDGATPGNGMVENWFELLDSWFNVPDAEDLRKPFVLLSLALLLIVVAGVSWAAWITSRNRERDEICAPAMISFIVPAHNEQASLGRTLEAIHKAARAVGQPYEIIVVDDASTDATPEIAAQNNARVVSVNHRQIAATRNSGARAAQGERLLFVDADTTIDSRALASALRAMDNGAAGGGAPTRLTPLRRFTRSCCCGGLVC